MNLLEMNHIVKEFDGLEVIKDISISVKEGEILSIIGPFRFRKIHAPAVRYHAGAHHGGENPVSGRAGGLPGRGREAGISQGTGGEKDPFLFRAGFSEL